MTTTTTTTTTTPCRKKNPAEKLSDAELKIVPLRFRKNLSRDKNRCPSTCGAFAPVYLGLLIALSYLTVLVCHFIDVCFDFFEDL